MSEPLCTHCGTPIRAKNDINDEWLIVCEHCDTPHYLNAAEITGFEAPKQKLNLPKRLTINQKPDGVEIRYREAKIFYLLLGTIFAVLWTLTGLVVSTGAKVDITIFGLPISQNPIMTVVYDLIFITIGAMSWFWIVTGFVNHTIILFMSKHIEISEGSLQKLPDFTQMKNIIDFIDRGVWTARQLVAGNSSGKQVIDASEIEQVYCTGDKDHDYGVWLKKRSGFDTVLVKGLNTYDQAHFIEQGIERLYHIEPQPQSKPKIDLGTFKFSD